MTTSSGLTGLPQYPHFVELHIWIPLLRQQVAQAAKNHLEEVQLYGLLPSWFACEINHSHPRLPYRRPAERLSPDNNALAVDVNNVTSLICLLQGEYKKTLSFRAWENSHPIRMAANYMNSIVNIFDDA